MLFHVPRTAIDSFVEETSRVETLHCDAGTLDPVIASLGKALLPALLHPKEASTLFIDHVILALKAHVVHAYGNAQRVAPPRPRGLAPWQERRAKAFLMEHLAGDVSLATWRANVRSRAVISARRSSRPPGNPRTRGWSASAWIRRGAC
jgi:hypothetical protein